MKCIARLSLSSSCSLLLAMVCLAPAFATAQDLTPEQKDRAERLEKFALAIEQVKVDREQSTGDQQSGDRRYSRASELHLSFHTAVTGLENDNKDAAVIFPMHASGFTRIIDSRSDGQLDSGSDLKKVKVSIADFFGAEGKPKATIDVPEPRHGSTFPAQQIARDEIQRLLEEFLPEVEIDGMQRFFEKELAVRNNTEEPITVWLVYRTRRHNEQQGWHWTWQPSEPGEGEPLTYTVDAGSTLLLKAAGDDSKSDNVRAARVRLWAESESGSRWLEYRDEDLWLVDKNPKFDGLRRYHAEKIERYVHTIQPQPGPKVFSERVVRFRNASPEPVSLSLRYYTRRGGSLGWRSMQLQIPPGQTVSPRGDDGMRIRASRLRFSAASENRRWLKYAERTLWLVEESAGRRVYQAEEIGTYLYVLEPKAAGASKQAARVTADNAPIKIGNETLGTLEEGDQFTVEETRGGWVRGTFDVGGQQQTGWVQASALAIDEANPLQSPASDDRKLRVTGRGELKIGDTTVATVARNSEYQVLEQNGDWYRVEVLVDGQPLHGWLHRGQVQVLNN